MGITFTTMHSIFLRHLVRIYFSEGTERFPGLIRSRVMIIAYRSTLSKHKSSSFSGYEDKYLLASVPTHCTSSRESSPMKSATEFNQLHRDLTSADTDATATTICTLQTHPGANTVLGGSPNVAVAVQKSLGWLDQVRISENS